eukprot:TRINITY_DN2664_c0_g1_i1.p2 TRINITY_DN2664_c0_g1~~TRINITY_DN2664_c0_g1_i1.p2  ORF type:complete len:279 (+),score=118.32 TRINITY_DN2664_c0_g1_i1:52-837(+)
MACVLDPNGIRVRLMESSDYYVVRRSHGRLAYVNVPVRDYVAIEKSIQFYDEIVSLSARLLMMQATGDANRISVSTSSSASRLFSSSSSSTSSSSTSSSHQRSFPSFSSSSSTLSPSAIHNLTKKMVAFKLVDFERFVEDLTTYFWLGNGPRRKYACLSLLHKIDRQSAQASSAIATLSLLPSAPPSSYASSSSSALSLSSQFLASSSSPLFPFSLPLPLPLMLLLPLLLYHCLHSFWRPLHRPHRPPRHHPFPLHHHLPR